MELSAGDMIAPDKWQISVGELDNAWIAPPDNFSGTIDLLAELHLPDGKIADRAALRFDWVAPAPPPAQQETALEEASPAPALALASAEPDRQESLSEQPIPPPTAEQQSYREENPASVVSSARAPGRPEREQIGARSLSAPAPLLSQPEPKDITASPAVSQHPAQRQVDQAEIVVLLKRGKNLIASGDLAAARIVLRRAADANDAEAALALAATYDPFVLQELKVYGFTGDVAIARSWYEKAAELGSSAAPRRLQILTRGSDGR
jgi:TPR repeat protein